MLSHAANFTPLGLNYEEWKLYQPCEFVVALAEHVTTILLVMVTQTSFLCPTHLFVPTLMSENGKFSFSRLTGMMFDSC